MFTTVSVYCFARLNLPALLETFQVTYPALAAQTFLFGSAPSFFYTLSIGLLVGACASSLPGAWLAETLPGPTWEPPGPHWSRGAFDHLDLIATVLGGSIALATLTYLPMEQNDEIN